MLNNVPIVVTRRDYERLQQLLDGVSGANRDLADELETELARAEVVDSDKIPPDVVTMNSRVVFRDENSGKEQEVQLCYPSDVKLGEGRISVLAPVGAALLGLRVGQEIEWPLPSGATKKVKVVAVKYQPEAAGDFHL